MHSTKEIAELSSKVQQLEAQQQIVDATVPKGPRRPGSRTTTLDCSFIPAHDRKSPKDERGIEKLLTAWATFFL